MSTDLRLVAKKVFREELGRRSVSSGPPLVPRPIVHRVCNGGNHYFKMKDGLYECECGALRDRSGRPVKQR